MDMSSDMHPTGAEEAVRSGWRVWRECFMELQLCDSWSDGVQKHGQYSNYAFVAPTPRGFPHELRRELR